MFRPTFQNPPYDANNGAMPDRIYAPPSINITVNASQRWFDEVGNDRQAAVNAILAREDGTLQAFFNGQRQLAAGSGMSFWAREIRLRNITARFSHNSGHDLIEIEVRPENDEGGNEATGIDPNVDGYIAYVIAQPGYPDTVVVAGQSTNSICGPYSFYLNGTLLNPKPYTVSGPCEIYICAFGTTALRSSSLQDVPQESSPFANNKGYPLIQLDAPFGGAVPDLTGPDGSTTIPKHPDALGYWWNSFIDVRNQAAWIRGTATTGAGYGFWNSPNPKVYQGIQFRDARDSPLNWRGQNFATMYPDPNQSFQEVLWYGCVYSEFYNRLQTRLAKRSWLYGPYSIPTILINDKPMLFAAGGQGFNGSGAVQINMGFDLTPMEDPAQSDDNCFVPWGSGPPTGSDGDGVAQKQLDEYDEWVAKAAKIEDDYANSVASELETLVSNFLHLGDEILAYPSDLAHFYHGSVTVSQIGESQVFGGVTIPALSIFYAPVDYPFTYWEPRNSATGWLSLQDDYYNVYAQIDTLISAPQTFPLKPFGYGSGPDTWSYRDIQVSGNDWSFGDWQGG